VHNGLTPLGKAVVREMNSAGMLIDLAHATFAVTKDAVEVSTRVSALRRYKILDTAPEGPYEDATLLATEICSAPIALLTLVDSNREWFKSKVGIKYDQLPRYGSFCAQAIHNPDEVLVVPDASQDPGFVENALVQGDPGVRFYVSDRRATAKEKLELSG
jgi:GAF domain-containing protein